MQKSNVLKSSLFHMDAGDILHMLFLDESGVPVTYSLNSIDPITGEDNIEEVPDAPTALDASDITGSGFVANWSYTENTLGFYLDVAKDSAFTSLVAGYSNLNVGLVNEYTVAGLAEQYTYYYRLRGYNDYGTSGNSNSISFTTIDAVKTDIDGNVYTLVTIGTQQWLIENYRATKYADGTAIANLTLAANWLADATGAYVWYNNDVANKTAYGALYNQFATVNAHGFPYILKDGVYDATWRMPLQADFATLSTFLGGDALAGGILKETGIVYWNTPNVATNDYGFNLRGAGYRNELGTFAMFNRYTALWTATDAAPPTNANNRYIINTDAGFNDSNDDKNFGFSVRLMRDV